MDQAEKLLQAHIAFELKRWTAKKVSKDLDPFIDGVWNWLDDTHVSAMVSADTAVDTALRWLDQWYLPDTLTVLIGSIAKRLIQLPVNTQTRIGDVVDDELYNAGVELIVDMDDLRENLIKQATESPLYAMLISNVLYSGIRDYLSSSSGAVQKVPGMGSLLSKGSAALNKRMPGLESAIEDRLRNFIRGNTEKSIRNSQQFLLDALGPDEIRQLAEEIWKDGKDAQLSVTDMIGDEDIDRLASFGLQVWHELRQTEYIQELVREGIQGFYEVYGSQSLAALLNHIGLNRDLVSEEIRTLAPELLQHAHDTGLLETWLELQLAPFYRSTACTKLLNA